MAVDVHGLVVLGGSGFLGAHVVARASRAGGFGSVTSVARQPGPEPRLRRAAGAFEREARDLEQAGALERLLERRRPAVVVSCAALARIADCAREPARARELNAALAERVALWCRARSVRLVHVSTDLVFGGRPPRGERFTEDDPVAPLSVYGRSKAEGEGRVLAAHPRALVVRLPLLFGDSGGRAEGASDALLAALERGERPGLFQDELRTPLDAGNAAEALLELARGERRGLLHVAGPERLSRLELGREVLRAAGMSDEAIGRAVCATSHAALDGGPRPSDVSLDASLARALLATPLLAPREALTALP